MTPWNVAQAAPTLLHGFLLYAGMVIAIGPQNLFVLRQGLGRRHIFFTALLCTAGDMLLIGVSVGGLGAALAANQFFLHRLRPGWRRLLVLLRAARLEHRVGQAGHRRHRACVHKRAHAEGDRCGAAGFHLSESGCVCRYPADSRHREQSIPAG
jgi:ribosomal protein L37E